MNLFGKYSLAVGLLLAPFGVVADDGPSALSGFELEVVEDAGTVSVSGETIRINAEKGTDLHKSPVGDGGSDKGPRLLFEPEGDFILSARFEGALKEAYDGGALIVYVDETLWAKHLYERFLSGADGVSTTVTKGGGDGAYHGSGQGNVQYLKVVRYDDNYIFYASEDGSDWEFIRHFTLVSEKPVKIGFMTQAPLSESFTATFSDVRFRSERFKDFWQGE